MVLINPRETFVGYFTQGDADDKVTGANLTNHDGTLSKYGAQWDFSNMPFEDLFHNPNMKGICIIQNIFNKDFI